ncbi:ABC transporter ATP-binding protein [Rhizobium leguminosarum]|uniref:ABC transporter ATP-binding protein n=1 Tax=Rhizobium leguminosarum TaxID=384 RepID=UPI001C92AAEF|nr:oligopeptide/dipeptide ABC transporter ATP-binding protein [Rhizobium leguminosarum]
MMPESQPIIAVHNVGKSFDVRRSLSDRLSGRPEQKVAALNDVSLSVAKGETVAVVGESGCGKSTLARCLVRLYGVNQGKILFYGKDIAVMRGQEQRAYNRRVQMIFQDPYSSLNPRMTVGQTLAEALLVNRICPRSQVRERIQDLLKLVNLPADAADRYPRQFSGGQRQRIGIARALSVNPECIIADEILSALDVSVQAQIINLLIELQQKLQLSLVFVSHDLRVVRYISHRVVVMYLGSIVETGLTEDIFNNPQHPYTKALLAAAPEVGLRRPAERRALTGELPSPLSPPSGCTFHPRCPQASDRCKIERPLLLSTSDTHRTACHLFPARADG